MSTGKQREVIRIEGDLLILACGHTKQRPKSFKVWPDGSHAGTRCAMCIPPAMKSIKMVAYRAFRHVHDVAFGAELEALVAEGWLVVDHGFNGGFWWGIANKIVKTKVAL